MKGFLAAHIIEVITIAVAAITAVGVFLGPWLANGRQRKATVEDTKLRAHFEKLRAEAEGLVSLASNATLEAYHAEIVFPEQSTGVCVTLGDIEALEISGSLEAHFHKQCQDWRQLTRRILEHNTNCKEFRQKIKIAFQSQRIPVVQNDPGEHSICIFEAALDALFNRWQELARNVEPRPDFENINCTQVEGGLLSYASGWGASAVAFAKTEDGQDKCKRALGEIAGDAEKQSRAVEIVKSANELVRQAKQFAGQFASEINDIGEYWRGKKDNEFEPLKKSCPECKKLF